MRKFYLFLLFFIAGCGENSFFSKEKKNVEVSPSVVQRVQPVTPSTPVRVADLTNIAIALEKYKLDRRQYPISSKSGTGWDGIYTKYGKSGENWIEGLVPQYIEKLPVDPRRNTSTSQQYLYRSDGANYKLLAWHSCKEIIRVYKDLVDPKRKCAAYGYWTEPAANW